MHIIQSLSIEPSYDVHYIAEYDWSVECSRLWCIANGIYFHPFALIDIKLVYVVESLLVGIHTSKNVDVAATDYGWMAISRLRWWAIGPVNFIPVIGEETVLEDIVHSVMAVPASKDEHRILKDHSRVTKAIQRLDAVTFDFFPLVLLILDAALVHISKPLFAIIASVHKHAAIPKYYGVVSSLTWCLTRLQGAYVKPFELLEIIIKQIFVEISALLLVATKEIEFIVVAHTFSARSRQRYFTFVGQQAPFIGVDFIHE